MPDVPEPLTLDLIVRALGELGWEHAKEAEDECGVTFRSPGKPSVHVSLKAAGPRLVATSALDLPIRRDRWGEALVDINEDTARNFRPKVYLSVVPDSDAGMLLGEEVHDAPQGTTAALLAAWIAGHARAFAHCAATIAGVRYD
jgi:hypothetical protein